MSSILQYGTGLGAAHAGFRSTLASGAGAEVLTVQAVAPSPRPLQDHRGNGGGGVDSGGG
ncbi:uncharacterized protein PG986_000347 [Apiospora aurea]|uniref:Uncharacterized protein n=1 Tax=Apiospora aurea TaxID=335848 RepID=A0ABR1QTT8_9PEZI